MNTSNTPINIIIADDHEIFREGFKLLWKKQKEIVVIAEASNGRELVNMVEKQKPDVVMMDVRMPLMDGIEACRIIKNKFPDISIIALSTYDEQSIIVDKLEAGVNGYLLKSAGKHEITEAIQTVVTGDIYFSGTTSTKLFHLLSKTKYNPIRNSKVPEFTNRELQIIALLCKEYTNKEIAAELGLCNRTVEDYKMRIQNKIGAKNMVGIAVYALKNHLIAV